MFLPGLLVLIMLAILALVSVTVSVDPEAVVGLASAGVEVGRDEASLARLAGIDTPGRGRRTRRGDNI